VVIAAGKRNPRFGDVAGEYQRYWIEQSRALSHRSSNSKFADCWITQKKLFVLYRKLFGKDIIK
jgi:hypothetical protein